MIGCLIAVNGQIKHSNSLINIGLVEQNKRNNRLEKRTNFQSKILYKPCHKSIIKKFQAYNDAIRVYEAKLVEFGIPPEELGFQVLDTKTSTMPAGLVSS